MHTTRIYGFIKKFLKTETTDKNLTEILLQLRPFYYRSVLTIDFGKCVKKHFLLSLWNGVAKHVVYVLEQFGCKTYRFSVKTGV